MDLDNLPTLEQICSQRLLTPLQVAEMEGRFRRSRLLDRPPAMSPAWCSRNRAVALAGWPPMA
jgi:hypothetical protein